MKCPGCGEELKEGYLYCENCGEDIHIVPDFEPEFELSLKQAVEEIMDLEEAEERQKQEQILAKKRMLKKLWKVAGAVGVVCLLALAGAFVRNLVKEKQENSFEYQLSKAYECMSSQQTAEALVHYEKAVVLQPKEANVRLELAEVYRMLGMENFYLEQLQIVAAADYAKDFEVEKAYEKMIAFYAEKENYTVISDLLLNCSNNRVLNANQKYLAKTPEFSYQEGSYAEIIPLKISSNAAGTIYYTMDGSVPDIYSEVYTSPLFLEPGSYVISALFVNEYGIVSDVITKSYVVEMPRPAAPEVSLYSGNYALPQFVSVEIPEGCRVFYTTDGSYPTDQSAEYFSPIPLPLGTSWYKFVTYSPEGLAGEVTVREYELVIDTEVTVSEACQAVVDVMMAKGKIYNSLGESYQVEGKYSYIFQYPLAVEDQGDYYIIAEFYEDATGFVSRTGSEYAVNIYDETVYKFTKNNGNYLLEGF